MGLLGMHCICSRAFRLLENPPFSVEIRQPSFPFISMCVLDIAVFPFSCKIRLAAYTGAQILLIGEWIDCRDLLSVPFANRARVPEN